MPNQRTFYACQAVALTPQIPSPSNPDVYAPATQRFVHGVQSIGFNSTFNVENIFELGQLELYDTNLTSAEVEVTIEKVLDGFKTSWGIICNGSTDLAVAAKNRVDLNFVVFADTGNAGKTGPEISIQCTGMYVNNVTYSFPVEGNPTESVTLIGDNKSWGAGSLTVPANVIAGTETAAVLKRSNITVNAPGGARKQNCTLSLSLNREPVYQLGQFAPYARFATYPLEVTAEVEELLITSGQDSFNEGTDEPVAQNSSISVTAGTLIVDLGNRCFLSSTSQSGGDASGGNATLTNSYTTYNTFTVTDTGAF
jgi:hypothetical protein